MAGIVYNHIKFCNLEKCKCTKIKFNGDTEFQDADLEAMPLNKQYKIERNLYLEMKYKNIDKMICEILNLNLENTEYKETSSEQIIIVAYVNYYLMDRTFNALYNIMQANEINLSYFQKFMIFCLK